MSRKIKGESMAEMLNENVTVRLVQHIVADTWIDSQKEAGE